METNLLYVDDNYERAADIKCRYITDKLNEIFRANISIQPGYFLSEVKLVNGTTQYKFPTLNQGDIDNTIFPLSYGVNVNDIFIGYGRELTVDTRIATTSTLIEVQKYYNKLVFTAGTVTTPAHIQFIWNSIWNYAVGNKTQIQNQLTRKDLDQPRTQQSAANNWPEYHGSKLMKIAPYMVISGKATNYLNFLIQTGGIAFAGGGVDPNVTILSWYMQGFTIQNGAGFSQFYTGGLDIELYVAEYIRVNTVNNMLVAADKRTPLETSASFGNLGN